MFPPSNKRPIGAELYDRWKNLFTLDKLNEAVSSQIEALDENVRNSFQWKFTLFSYIFYQYLQYFFDREFLPAHLFFRGRAVRAVLDNHHRFHDQFHIPAGSLNMATIV